MNLNATVTVHLNDDAASRHANRRREGVYVIQDGITLAITSDTMKPLDELIDALIDYRESIRKGEHR